MSDEKKPIPKPSIPKPSLNNPAPKAPPVTTFDDVEPAPPTPGETPRETPAPDAEEQESPAPEPNGAETDLVKRFLGAFIDAIVAGVVGYLIFTITKSAVLQWVGWALVFLTRDSLPFLDGQSIGKKMMKTKAVKEDGSSLSGDWVTGATRNILLAIPFAGLVECVIILTRSGRPDDGRRLGDDWAKTKVISVE